MVYGNEDDRWSSLNPDGFKYGAGGASAQHLAWSSVLTDNVPGFLNYYSTTAAVEDKAEVHANLIVNSPFVERRMKLDPIMREKVKLLKERLNKLCPDVNAAFWEKAKKIPAAG
jgi:hypothetical protein